MDFRKILFKTNAIDVEKALPDGVIFCTKDGKIQWANDKIAELFDTPKMNLLTSNISCFIENIFNLISNALIYDKPVITKMISSEVYFDMTVNEIEDGYVLDFRDVSGQNEFDYNYMDNSEVLSVNKNKNAFWVKLANDLKSPLQSIVGFSQAMMDGLGGNISEQQDKYIKIIKKNSTDLMYFIDKLIDLSSSELNLDNVEFKTFDMVNTINSVIKYNQQLYEGKNIKWSISSEEDFKNTVITDENILRKVLQCILEVILKSVEMGDINFFISTPSLEILNSKGINNGEYFMISITSSTLLLSESELELMFEPYQIIDTPNRKNLLRAMTLACVKNLVQALKGRIWVESKILQNTSFNIIIPQIKRN